jgi:hypothetical protein
MRRLDTKATVKTNRKAALNFISSPSHALGRVISSRRIKRDGEISVYRKLFLFLQTGFKRLNLPFPRASTRRNA